MGLKSSSEISEKLVIATQPEISQICDTKTEVPNNKIRKVFTIQDMMDVLGPRIPSVTDSQKDFNMAFVMVVPEGETLTLEQSDALNWVANKFPITWYKSTSGKSTINGVIPTDLVPPVISNVKVKSSSSSITVSWDTDEPASGFVIYTPENYYRSIIYPNLVTNPPQFFTTNTITLDESNDLTDHPLFWYPNTNYKMKIISIDENYNMASYDVGTVKTKP